MLRPYGTRLQQLFRQKTRECLEVVPACLRLAISQDDHRAPLWPSPWVAMTVVVFQGAMTVVLLVAVARGIVVVPCEGAGGEDNLIR